MILGWNSINEGISLTPVVLYIGAIFWTLGYDTIYGFQDINDDEIIGLKSTSIKFKSNPKFFLIICYSIFFLVLLITGYLMELNKYYFLFLILIFFQLFYYQIKRLNTKMPSNCLEIFKSNNLLGFAIFLNILLGKI